ncbi:hypothetical protein [Vibrio sp. MA40-2]|uniref:capsular polysaccharide export protein, LipB/KpsS family n=1 Tax=Vibrio sp. MA40-2 TaxID=3391828 RepID=UPI0039A60A15
MKILLDPGLLSSDFLRKINEKFSENIQILSENDERYELYKNIASDLYIHRNPTCSPLNDNLKICPHFIIEAIINDHKTMMLYDRSNSPFKTTSKKIRWISSICDSVYKFIKMHKPDMIIYPSTPHGINTWIMAKVAESMSVKVCTFQISIVPWRVDMLEGLHRNQKRISLHDELYLSKEEKELIHEFTEKKKASRDVALPDYEAERLRANRGKYYNIIADLKNNWRRPDLLVNKYRCFYKYNELAVSEINKSQDYSVFFLHYQPERTTLPEGYGFSQQLLAIKELRAALPVTTSLYVKEHPSTFTNLCHWKERDTDFYNEICSIPGVELLSLDYDSYELMDKATLISTITGSVGVEALIRGNRVVFFGCGAYIHHNKSHKYTDRCSLKEFIDSESDSFFDVESQLFGSVSAYEGPFLINKNNYNSIKSTAISNGIYQFLQKELNE